MVTEAFPKWSKAARVAQWLVATESRLKLRQKLFISYLVIVLLLATSIGYFAYWKSASIVQEQASKAYAEALRQTSINIEYRLKEIENVSEVLYTNLDLQEVLRRAQRGYTDKSKELDDFRILSTLARNWQQSANIYRVRLFVPGDPLFAYERVQLFPLEEAEADPFLADIDSWTM